MFETNVYKTRRAALRSKLNNGIVLMLGNTEMPMNYAANTYHFRQDSSFLYFFGIDLPCFAGVIDVDNDKNILFGNDVDIEAIIWMGPQESVKDKGLKIGVEATEPIGNLSVFIKKAMEQGRKIHYLPPYRTENKLILQDLLGIQVGALKNYASEELIKAVVAIRSIKEECEIKELEIACEIGYEMHYAAMRYAKQGIYERQVSGMMEGIALSKGTGVSFPIILTQNGETLHNHCHDYVLQNGRLMLQDAGAESTTHYASDFTRTIPVSGKFTQQQREIYQIVLDANNKAFEMIKPGVSYQSVHIEAAMVIAKGLSALGLMKGNAEEAVKQGAHALFFPHGLGHMMGLDVHDMEDLGEKYVGYDEQTKRSDQFGLAYLRFGKILQTNYVLTIEPGIYFIPALIEQWKNENKFMEFINYAKVEQYIGFGGVRLEDDVIVTKTGAAYIGKRLPITIDEIEAVVGK